MISMGPIRWFVFPWADGGNLTDLWQNLDDTEDRHYTRDIVDQLAGIAAALERMHNFKYGEADSYRHGDLKPENILIFDRQPRRPLGIWKLSDFGLAKYHTIATGDRRHLSSSRGAGTISYQPPEVYDPKIRHTTRLYDMWSMGCIILQILTWFTYGIKGIRDLSKRTKSTLLRNESSYFQPTFNDQGGWQSFVIHTKVRDHMQQLELHFRSSPVMKALLSVVQEKLLVVKLPPSATRTADGCRTNAAGLREALAEVEAEGHNYPEFWRSGGRAVQQHWSKNVSLHFEYHQNPRYLLRYFSVSIGVVHRESPLPDFAH